MDNHYTKEEQDKIEKDLNFQIYFHIILCIFGFYLIIKCYNNNEFIKTFFESILNMVFPYLFIPLKLFFCRENLKNICLFK